MQQNLKTENNDYIEILRKSSIFYKKDLSQMSISPDVLHLVDKKFSFEQMVLPMSFAMGCLTLVTAKVENFTKYNELLTAINLQKEKKSPVTELKLLLCDFSNLQEGFKIAYGKKLLQENTSEENSDSTRAMLITAQTKMVEKIIDDGIAFNASDVHITPYSKGSIVQYRVDGKLQKAEVQVNEKNRPYVINIIKAMASLDPANKLVPQDGAFKYKGIEFRVNTYPTVYDEKVNLRILNGNTKLLKLADMHFPDREKEILQRVTQYPYGIILMTGPTGQGKSTTLYACMRERSTEENVILSAEDPVEQRIEGAAQAVIKPLLDNEACSFTFAKALRASLRQDPDIVFVGEIRDRETGITAVQASQTGHLLFATLHCRSAIHSIQRIVDMGIDRNSFLSEMVCIISQRLLAVNCPHCRKKIIADLNNRLRKQDLAKLEEGKYSYVSVGCNQCNHTGTLGRIPAIEIVEFDNAIRDYFSTQRGLVETEDFLRKKGFRSLWDMGMDYVAQGKVSLKELLSTLSPDYEVKS